MCDAINKKITPEKKTPLLHSIRRLMFEGGKMYKNFAIPHDDGIPPPVACLTASPAPAMKESNIKYFVENPDNLSKEYRELLSLKPVSTSRRDAPHLTAKSPG